MCIEELKRLSRKMLAQANKEYSFLVLSLSQLLITIFIGMTKGTFFW